MTNKILCNREQLLQNHLCGIPVATIRDALKIDDSAVSRIKSGERRISFAEFCAVIALPSESYPQGLALAPARAIIVTREHKALKTLARDFLNMGDEA